MDSPHPNGMGEPACRLRPLPVKDVGDTLAAEPADRPGELGYSSVLENLRSKASYLEHLSANFVSLLRIKF